MEDFNQYASKNKSYETNFFDKIKNIAKNFDGKSQEELLSAIYAETKKGKENGTLTNRDIEKFAKMISPFLDQKKKEILDKLVVDLKNIG